MPDSLYDRIRGRDDSDAQVLKVEIWPMLNDVWQWQEGTFGVNLAEIGVRHSLNAGEQSQLSTFFTKILEKAASDPQVVNAPAAAVDATKRDVGWKIGWHILTAIERKTLTKTQVGDYLGITVP